MSIWAILVAGGKSERFGGQNKLLANLAGKPVIRWSYDVLCQIPELAGIVVVGGKQYQACLGDCRWATSGTTRRESVWQGLLQVPSEAEIVLIHDAARPLVQLKNILAALAPVQNGEAIGTSLGMPVRDTIKQVKIVPLVKGACNAPLTCWVEATLERSNLWATHTPQVFNKQILLQAHQKAPLDRIFPDDASLVEHLGQPVLMVQDSPGNLKITVPEDLVIAQALLSRF